MLEKAFIYNQVKQEWEITEDAEITSKDISILPLVFTMLYEDKQWIWCPSHRNFEELMETNGIVCDRIPDFIDIYNHLKNGECGDWRIWDEEDIWIAFTAPEQRKDIVYLSAGAEGTYSSITRDYWRKDILQMLKDVFKSLLMDKDFPYQYPCFDELDEAMCEKAQEEAEIQARGNLDLEDELYKAACREGRVLLTAVGKEHYLRYKKMLEDCINS